MAAKALCPGIEDRRPEVLRTVVLAMWWEMSFGDAGASAEVWTNVAATAQVALVVVQMGIAVRYVVPAVVAPRLNLCASGLKWSSDRTRFDGVMAALIEGGVARVQEA